MQGGGPTPQQLAESIANTTSGVTVVAASATTVINDGSSTLSSPRSMGSFANGLTAPGTQLPAANGGSPTVTYAGGLGVASGVCLCTGLVTDGDGNDGDPAPTGRGVGVEGPNNGYGDNNDGEISKILLGDGVIDADFQQAVFTSQGLMMPANSGDPVVLQFNVQIASPGFLSVMTVFGSDEYDQYIDQPFNDSFAILIKNECTEYENIAVLNEGGVRSPFSLQAIEECDEPHFLENQVAPQPTVLPPSPHAIDKNGDNVGDAADGVPHYDHEFGGFTSLRFWETRCPLAPGTYTVKIVVHDVADSHVDAALFVQEDSLRLFSFLAADFDLDGDVDGGDFLIWQQNNGTTGTAKFTDGDANGDCDVDGDDLAIWSAHFGSQGGNRNLKFDFDRDGFVSGSDFLTWQRNLGLAHCASRFEGDADGDGDVDSADNPFSGGSSTIADPCGGGGQQLAAAEEDGEAEFEAEDLDQDGDVDSTDAGLWLKSIGEGELAGP